MPQAHSARFSDQSTSLSGAQNGSVAIEASALVEKQLARSTSKWSDEEFKEILSALEKIEISTKVFNSDESKPAMKVPVLRLLDMLRDSLITGVTSRIGVDDAQKLLYYNVCPKLEVHELASIEKVAGVAWQRYRLTAKGKALLVYLDKRKLPPTPALEAAPPLSAQATAPPRPATKRTRRPMTGKPEA